MILEIVVTVIRLVVTVNRRPDESKCANSGEQLDLGWATLLLRFQKASAEICQCRELLVVV